MPQFKLYFMGVIYDRKTFMMPQFKLYFTIVIYDLWTFIALAPGVDFINLLGIFTLSLILVRWTFQSAEQKLFATMNGLAYYAKLKV
jgi:hypothetical protein